ncbi:putative ribonuclease H-like domain-containing protein [Tanacetum coccineum]
MEQYLTHTDYALWEVIVYGDAPVIASASTGTKGPIPPKTAEQKLARKNELKAKSTMLLVIPDGHLLKFHGIKDAKNLWEAIKARFGGNKESKKMQKTILKQQYENFAASRSEGLDKTLLLQLKANQAQTLKMWLLYLQKTLAVLMKQLDNAHEAPRNQGNRNGDAPRRVVPVETPANALVVQDGIGSSSSSSSDSKRVNHQNKLTHPHPKKNFVPTAVATKLGHVPVNAAKQNSPRAAASISTARPINTVAPKSKVNDALPKTYSYFKAHSPVRRAFNQKLATKTYNLNEKVKTVRVNNVTTAGPKAVVSAAVGYGENAVKSSARWIWRPIGNVIDHTSKDSGSYMFKRFDYGNPQYTLQDQGIFDSGCSRHMTGNKSFLIDYQKVDGGFVVFVESPKGGKITGKDKIRIRKLDFEDVYFVKELKFNLFSVSQMCDKKNSVLFTETECLVLSPDFKLLDERQVLLKVPRQNNMYSFDLKNVVPSGGLTCLFAKATIDESNLWHIRLGHINFKTMNKLVRGNLVRGLPSKLFENDHICIACQKGKQHKASCKTKLVSYISQPLQMLHMDLFGPTSVRSINHKIYCLIVTNDYSRFSWVFFLAIKDETSGILKIFITGIENQINHKVKIIICDNRTEFKNNDMNQFCRMKGIKREFSVSRTPQQNRVVERNNRTLIEKEGGASNKEDDQNVQDVSVTLDNLLVQQKKGYANSTNRDSTVSPSISTARQSFTNADDLPTDPLMPDLEDTADLLNIGYIKKHMRTNHKDYQNCLFACFLSQIKPKKVTQALTDPSWIELETRQDWLNKVTPKKKAFYDKVFAPVTRIEAIRLFLAYASFMGFIVYQMDVKSAFLYGTIEEEVYVCQPPSFENPQFPNKVYKVEKALYGLHQPPKAWYETLSTYLLDNRFRRGIIDKTLFIKKDKGDILLVQLYVDDIIFWSSKKSLCVEFKSLMHKKFQMSSMGELTFFLGLEVMQRDDGIFIS